MSFFVKQIRHLVSQHKRRFCEDGFDLDLSYITPRILGMAWPGDGTEGLLRNPMSEVVRFMEKHHANHYKVYNLCSERSYSTSKFITGECASYPYEDHQVPPMHLLLSFCKDAATFLEADSDNVVAVHCKAGKGRTGTCVCSLLLFLNLVHTWQESLLKYGERRATNGKGVTISSQRRWVKYFEAVHRTGFLQDPPPICLTSIVLTGFPADMSTKLVLVIQERVPEGTQVADRIVLKDTGKRMKRMSMDSDAIICGASADVPRLNGPTTSPQAEPTKSLIPPGETVVHLHRGDGWGMLCTKTTTTFNFLSSEDSEPFLLQGDFKIVVYAGSVKKSNQLFWAWQNTAYVVGTSDIIDRDQMDKVHKSVPGSAKMHLSWSTSGTSEPIPLETLPSVNSLPCAVDCFPTAEEAELILRRPPNLMSISCSGHNWDRGDEVGPARKPRNVLISASTMATPNGMMSASSMAPAQEYADPFSRSRSVDYTARANRPRELPQNPRHQAAPEGLLDMFDIGWTGAENRGATARETAAFKPSLCTLSITSKSGTMDAEDDIPQSSQPSDTYLDGTYPTSSCTAAQPTSHLSTLAASPFDDPGDNDNKLWENLDVLNTPPIVGWEPPGSLGTSPLITPPSVRRRVSSPLHGHHVPSLPTTSEIPMQYSQSDSLASLTFNDDIVAQSGSQQGNAAHSTSPGPLMSFVSYISTRFGRSPQTNQPPINPFNDDTPPMRSAQSMISTGARSAKKLPIQRCDSFGDMAAATAPIPSRPTPWQQQRRYSHSTQVRFSKTFPHRTLSSKIDESSPLCDSSPWDIRGDTSPIENTADAWSRLEASTSALDPCSPSVGNEVLSSSVPSSMRRSSIGSHSYYTGTTNPFQDMDLSIGADHTALSTISDLSERNWFGN